MFRAVWNGTVLAESDQTVKLEGSHYFPAASLNREYFTPSKTTTTCPWKGAAGYYDVTVNGQVNRDAAWYYPHPSPAARQIKDHVAFWRGIKVVRAGAGDPASRGGVAARLRSMFDG
jgi:uncharacterized protein (DUF427 family)